MGPEKVPFPWKSSFSGRKLALGDFWIACQRSNFLLEFGPCKKRKQLASFIYRRRILCTLHHCWCLNCSEAEFLDEIQTNVLRVFSLLFTVTSVQLCLRFLLLQTNTTSYSFCKGERMKPDRNPYPLPYGLRNSYRRLKSENSQDYVQNARNLRVIGRSWIWLLYQEL